MKYDRNNNPIYRDAFGRRIHNGDTLSSPANKTVKIKVVKNSENEVNDYCDEKTRKSLSKYNLSTLIIVKSTNIRKRELYARF